MRKVVSIMLKVAFVIASGFTLVTLFFSKGIMHIYTNDIDVIEKGSVYFMWSLPTFLLMGTSLTLTQVLRSVQAVKVPLYASIVGFFTNIFFNWVFIFGKFGMPQMQIAGAALGTVIARIFETTIIAYYFFHMDNKIAFRMHHILMKAKDLLDRYVKFCLPVIASDLLLGFGNTAVSIVIGHMGTSFVAAYAIIAVIQRLSTVFTSGIGQAAHTITGNRIGEGKKEQAKQEAVTMLSIAVILGIAAGLIMKLLGPVIISHYNITEETSVIASKMLNAVALMIVFQSMQSVITKGVLRGGGDTKFCLAIDAVFLWILSVPLGILTGLVLHLDPFIVLLSLKIDWAVKSIIGTHRILSGKWINELTA